MKVNFKDEILKDNHNNGFNVHDDLKDLAVEDLRVICDENRVPFVMSSINVTGDMNMGSMIRTASLFGAQKFVVFGRKKFDRRGLVGAQNYIDIEFVPCLNEDLSVDEVPILKKLENDNLIPVVVEQGGLPLGSFKWSHFITKGVTPCLLVGNENRGIPNNVIEALTNLLDVFFVSIPQKGVLRSHNVSCAASVIMFDMCKEMGWL